MEKHSHVSYNRVLSDSSQTTQLSDASENYYSEVFDLLPSVQASRRERYRHRGLGLEESVNQSLLSRGTKDKVSLQPLRNLTMCIQGKRHVRDMRKMQISTIGYWESWKQSQSLNWNRAWAKFGGAITGLLPWQRTLHAIESRFGVGVKSYFIFLRYLVYLNLLHCAVISGFILLPMGLHGWGNNSEPLRFGGNDSVLDFLLGTGYLDRSPVFFGFYTHGSLSFHCLNPPLLYITGILVILLLSLVMAVRRTTVGYKHTWMLGKRYKMKVSYKIFCGWDFNIQEATAASLKHSFIRNDLKLLIEEQRFSLYKAQRSVRQRVRLYLLRFILNLLVLVLLSGAFYLIYFATETLRIVGETSHHHWIVYVLLQYLPPFTISFVNLLLPHVFRKISSFEDYCFTVQVNATLIRSIFLKLASLGIYLFYIFIGVHPQCWENQFGREMYKLCIFNFIAAFCNAFFFSYPRMLVQQKYPMSTLARLSGKQHFLIHFNVLDLVYSQTVSWVGVYFCPLLPPIGTVTLIATFYIKKFEVLRCCVAEQRTFRGSHSLVLFHFMLLLGLLMAGTTLLFSISSQLITPDQNMQFTASTCGPFANGVTLRNLTGVCVDSLPGPGQTVIRFLASEGFILPFMLFEIIMLTSYVSRRRANQTAIERLKHMLVLSCSDKKFLVRKEVAMHHRKKRPTPESASSTAPQSPSSSSSSPCRLSP